MTPKNPFLIPTMAAAARILGVDLATLRGSKRRGCSGFKINGSVDVAQLAGSLLRGAFLPATEEVNPRQEKALLDRARRLAIETQMGTLEMVTVQQAEVAFGESHRMLDQMVEALPAGLYLVRVQVPDDRRGEFDFQVGAERDRMRQAVHSASESFSRRLGKLVGQHHNGHVNGERLEEPAENPE